MLVCRGESSGFIRRVYFRHGGEFFLTRIYTPGVVPGVSFLTRIYTPGVVPGVSFSHQDLYAGCSPGGEFFSPGFIRRV